MPRISDEKPKGSDTKSQKGNSLHTYVKSTFPKSYPEGELTEKNFIFGRCKCLIS